MLAILAYWSGAMLQNVWIENNRISVEELHLICNLNQYKDTKIVPYSNRISVEIIEFH